MLSALRLCVIDVRKKLLSPFHTIMPTFCQPPLNCTVNSVSAVQLEPSAAKSWPMKFTGPTDVLAAAASSSQSAVGSFSVPPDSESAPAPVTGVPPLRVWRIHCEPSVVPLNSSERVAGQPAPEITRNVIVLTAEVLLTLSVAR